MSNIVPRDGNHVPIVDPALEIAEGTANGHSPVLKFGRNPSTAAGDDIWSAGGVYVPPTQARLHDVVSTSTADTGTVLSSGTPTTKSAVSLIDSTATFSTDTVAVGDIVLNDTTQDHSIVTAVVSETELSVVKMHHGTFNSVGDSYRVVTAGSTGAVVAHIKSGLDSNFDQQSEFVVLNGQTDVETTKSYLRINRFHIHGAGSGGVNAGVISVTAQTDATVTAEIPTGFGQTLMAHYTIPRNYKAYITNVYATINKVSGTTPSADIVLWEHLWAGNTTSVGDGKFLHGYWGVTPQSSGTLKTYNPYKFVSEFADVWLAAPAVAGTTPDISAGFDLILVKNE